MMRALITCFLAALLSGCTAKLVHTEIPNSLAAGSVVDGIPYRTPKRYVISVYKKTDRGYEEVHTKTETLPDPDRLYVLGFEALPFSTSTVELILNPNNTIQQVSLKSASTGQTALTALGTQVAAASTAEASRRTAEATATTTAATAASTAAGAAAALLVAAEKAKGAADLASVKYQLALGNPETTLDKLKEAEVAERNAKLDANEAARKAGLPPYYPDVVAGKAS